MKAIKIALTVSITTMLFGCWGGGGGDSPAGGSSATPTATPTSTPTPAVQAGYFIDSAVKGLTYSTATQSGTTGTKGDFKYLPGETVTFKLYGTELNTAAASVILTPADTKDVNLDYTINLLRFLQTVDTDNDPSNGITLPVVDAADAQVVIPLTLDMYEFETNQVVLSFLTKYAGGRTLVGVENAVNHFNNSISSYNTTILDLSGATLTARTWSSLCKAPGEGFPNTNFTVSNDGLTYTAKGDYIFGYAETITVATKLNSVECTQKAQSSTGTGNIANITMASHVLFGGPKFTYPQMNRLMISSPNTNPNSVSYGLKSVSLVWYTPGTRTINAAQHLIKTDGVTPRSPYYTLYQVYSVAGGTLYTPEVTQVQ